MSAYIEALPSDRPIEMLGRPVQRLYAFGGGPGSDLGDMPQARVEYQTEGFGSGRPYGVRQADRRNDVGNGFVSLADLADLGCCSMPEGMSDMGCCGMGDEDAKAEKDAAGTKADKRKDAVLAALRELAKAERKLVDADKAVIAQAADHIAKLRKARRGCHKRLKECQGKLGQAPKSTGLGHHDGPGLLAVAAELERVSKLDRTLTEDERKAVGEASTRLARIRQALSRVKAQLKVCEMELGEKDVAYARLAAKLADSEKKYDDHMKAHHRDESAK